MILICEVFQRNSKIKKRNPRKKKFIIIIIKKKKIKTKTEERKIKV